MARYSFSCFLCALSMWAGSFRSTSTEHLDDASFSVVRHRLDRTRHQTPQPPVSCFSSLGRTHSTFKNPPFLQNLYGSLDESPLSHMLRLSFHSSMPLLIRRSVRRRCRLSLVASVLSSIGSFCLVRFGRSSFFIPLFDSFANVLFPHSSCCTTVRFLFAFASHYLGCCLLVIDAYVSHQFHSFQNPSVSAAAYTHSLAFSLLHPLSLDFVFLLLASFV